MSFASSSITSSSLASSTVQAAVSKDSTTSSSTAVSTITSTSSNSSTSSLASTVSSTSSSSTSDKTRQLGADVVFSSTSADNKDVKELKQKDSKEQKLHAESRNRQWGLFQAEFERGLQLSEAELKARDAVSIFPSALQKVLGYFSNQDLVTLCLLHAYIKQHGGKHETVVLPLIHEGVFDEKSLKEICGFLSKSLTNETRAAIETLLNSVYRHAPLCSQRGSTGELASMRADAMSFIHQQILVPLCQHALAHKDLGKDSPLFKEAVHRFAKLNLSDHFGAIRGNLEGLSSKKYFPSSKKMCIRFLEEGGIRETLRCRSSYALQELTTIASRKMGSSSQNLSIMDLAKLVVQMTHPSNPEEEPKNSRAAILQLRTQTNIMWNTAYKGFGIKDVYFFMDSSKLTPFCVLDIIYERVAPIYARLMLLKHHHPKSALETLFPNVPREQLFLVPDQFVLISLLRMFRGTLSDKRCDLHALNAILNLQSINEERLKQQERENFRKKREMIREENLSILSDYFYKFGIDFTDIRNAIRALWASFDNRQKLNIRHRTPFLQESYELLMKELIAQIREITEHTHDPFLPKCGMGSVMETLAHFSQMGNCDGFFNGLHFCGKSQVLFAQCRLNLRLVSLVQSYIATYNADKTKVAEMQLVDMQAYFEQIRKRNIYRKNKKFAKEFEARVTGFNLALQLHSQVTPKGESRRGRGIKKPTKSSKVKYETVEESLKEFYRFYRKFGLDIDDEIEHLTGIDVSKIRECDQDFRALCAQPCVFQTPTDGFELFKFTLDHQTFLRKQSDFTIQLSRISELPTNGYVAGGRVLCVLIPLMKGLKGIKDTGVIDLGIRDEIPAGLSRRRQKGNNRSATTLDNRSIGVASQSSSTMTSTTSSLSAAAREVSLIDLGPAPTLTHQASQNTTTFQPLLDLTRLFSAAVDRLQKQKGEAHHTCYSNALASMRRVLPILEILLNCKEKEVQLMLCSELYHTMHTTFEQLLSAIVLLQGEHISHDLETLLKRTGEIGLKLEGELVVGPLLNGSPFVYRYPHTSEKGLVVKNVSLVDDPEGFAKLVRANLYPITTEFVKNLTHLLDRLMNHDDKLIIDEAGLDSVDASADAIRTKASTEEVFFTQRFSLTDIQKVRLQELSEKAKTLEAELQGLFKRLQSSTQSKSVLDSYRDCAFHVQHFKACCKWEEFFQPRYLDILLTPVHMSTCMAIENLFHSILKTQRKGADIQDEIAKIRHDLEKYYKHIWNKAAPTSLTSLNQLFGHYIHGTEVITLARLILTSRQASVNAYNHGQGFRRQEDDDQRGFKTLMEDTLRQMEENEKHLRVMIADIASKLTPTEETKQENKATTSS